MTLFWRPYHPGIDIGLDFLGWGLAWSLGILQLSESGSMSYDAEWSHLAGTERAGGAFVVLIGYVALVGGPYTNHHVLTDLL